MTRLVTDTTTTSESSTKFSVTVLSLTRLPRSADELWKRARSSPSSSAVLVWFGSKSRASQGVTSGFSDCDLVFRHFGKHVISNLYGWSEEEEKTQTIWLKMYSSFIQAVDA